MLSVLVFLLTGAIVTTKDVDTIMSERNKLLQNELNMMVGSDIILSDTEAKANEIIMDLKYKELDLGFVRPNLFNISRHFFLYKNEIEKTELFKLIKNMPKGAVLHAHDTAVLKADYIVGLTYLDDLFVCFEEDSVQFRFSLEVPDTPCRTIWQLMRDARFSSGNVEKFDKNLKKHFTLVIDTPNEVYTDVNTVWQIFQHFFISTSNIFCYKPVWEQYYYDTLKALKEDNVMYLEIRSVLPQLYDLEGNVYDSIATAKIYYEVTKRFLADNPDFYGAKLIYAPLRFVDAKTVEEYIEIAKEIKKELPDFFAGFDLVGQEDLGRPTLEFLPILNAASDELTYFFHAGETNWNGMSSDENIADAIVLGTRRLGHAYAIAKHPLLIEEIKKRDIALEVNVISNSVLGLVTDLRNHPLASYLAQGLPIVLSSDDPGCWDADPLSHDFYVTFVGVSSRHADLRLLKKLALNSLTYSTAPNKDKLFYDFEIRWTIFIDSVIRGRW